MKYSCGTDVRIGDRVKLWANMNGIIVSDFDNNKYLEGYSAKDWSDSPTGVLILSDTGDLFHYAEFDEDMVLIKRDEGG